MDFEVIPCQGTNILKLGLTSSQNTAILKKIPEKFRKSRKKDEPEVDDFGICHIYYNQEGISIAIEFVDTVNLNFHDTSLYGVKAKHLKKVFKKWDSDLIDDCCGGFVSLKYSIGITAEEGVVTGVMVAKEHYFDFWLDD